MDSHFRVCVKIKNNLVAAGFSLRYLTVNATLRLRLPEQFGFSHSLFRGNDNSVFLTFETAFKH